MSRFDRCWEETGQDDSHPGQFYSVITALALRPKGSEILSCILGYFLSAILLFTIVYSSIL